MKEGIHPDNYRFVVFKDMSNEYAFLGKSTANAKETIEWEDGNEYPLSNWRSAASLTRSSQVR